MTIDKAIDVYLTVTTILLVPISLMFYYKTVAK